MSKWAIICLTRGYDDKIKYNALIDRNRSIFNHINRKLPEQKKIPLIIFHEGNIPLDHQSHIIGINNSQEITFVDISDHCFLIPTSVPEIHNNSYVGYKHMCQFFSTQLWNYVTEYDFVIRLDEDCVLRDFSVENLSTMEKENLNYMIPCWFPENHDLTNRTLSKWIKEYVNCNRNSTHFIGRNPTNPYDHHFPYTNMFIARVSFWHSLHIQEFLKQVTESTGCYLWRWGDLPIHGLVINIFMPPDSVKTLTNVSYYHDSHQQLISC